MYKIVVKQTHIIINNYNFGDCPKLENSFKVWDKATFSCYYKQIEYNNETKQLIIPKGVDLGFIESLFNVKAYIDFSYNKFCSNSDSIGIRYKPRDERQVEALRFLSGQGNYFYTKNSSQLMLSLGTGAGKTYLSIVYISMLNVKTIVITDSNNWLEQWKERIQEHSSINTREIYQIKGSTSIISLLNKTPEELNSNKIYLVTHSSLSSYANNNGWGSLNELFAHLGIGLKIFDEAHIDFDNISRIDFHTNVMKTLYLTATPAKGDVRENEIYRLYFKNIPKFNAQDTPHTHYLAIKYKSEMTAMEISNCCNRHGFNKTAYCDLLISKPNFNMLLHIIINILIPMPGKKLIFLATNNAVQYVYNWIMTNYPQNNDNSFVGIFTSLNPDKQSALDCNIILTTSKSAGAALDIPNLMVSVQLAEPTKSEPQNRQRFGRTRNYNSLYIDCIDISCQITRNYYIQNLNMFGKYALSVKEKYFDNNKLYEMYTNIINNK